mmetsp:Transcript_25281/g.63788  ORF Transcript_25281/g.63788 Transcript_25281/m.63788 type:complete len:85 (-) Transcript_25281:8-262(-)
MASMSLQHLLLQSRSVLQAAAWLSGRASLRSWASQEVSVSRVAEWLSSPVGIRPELLAHSSLLDCGYRESSLLKCNKVDMFLCT